MEGLQVWKYRDESAGFIDERPIDDETRGSERGVPENFHGTRTRLSPRVAFYRGILQPSAAWKKKRAKEK